MFRLTNFAHEVYVLDPKRINLDQHQNKVNIFDALNNAHNIRIFIFISIFSALSFGLLLYLKSTNFFQSIGRFIDRATVVAPDIIRIALGLSLIVAAKNNAIFGPEIPLSSFGYPNILKPVLVVLGLALTFGILTRLFSAMAILGFCYLMVARGWYLVTYLNYFGEAIAVFLLPTQLLSIDNLIRRIRKIKPPKLRFERYSMPATRVFFGASLLYAAINVKFVTTAVSLDVVNHYDLTRYFHLDAMFVVLGAGLMECMIALLYLLGLLRRVVSIIFIAFIFASLLFFKEAVWPHYLLLATAIGIFLHKPDDWAMDKHLFSRKTNKKTPA